MFGTNPLAAAPLGQALELQVQPENGTPTAPVVLGGGYPFEIRLVDRPGEEQAPEPVIEFVENEKPVIKLSVDADPKAIEAVIKALAPKQAQVINLADVKALFAEIRRERALLEANRQRELRLEEEEMTVMLCLLQSRRKRNFIGRTR